MIDGKFVVGIILARGGSKRLPGKNILLLGGKPMVAWTIEAGLASKSIDRLILSSDDDGIMDAAKTAGCEVPFRRPSELSQDETTSADAVVHALDQLRVDEGYLVLLQPTSPLRTAADIDGCIDECHKSGAVSCATVSKLDCSTEWLVTLDEKGMIQKPFEVGHVQMYRPNGSVYVVDIKWFIENREFWVEGLTKAFETPPETAIDVDTIEDFKLAQYFLSQ